MDPAANVTSWIGIASVLLFFAVTVAFMMRNYRRDTSWWHPYHRFIATPIQLTNGTWSTSHILMRMKTPAGDWVYREISPEEQRLYFPNRGFIP